MKLFSRYSDLKPNLSKCELAGIGVLKGVKRALCGLTSIDLSQTTIKILGVHFSYNKTLRDEKNFVITIKKIETLLQIWRQRELTLEGKITIFKSLAISKIVYLAYLSDVPKYVIEELQKIQNSFIWNGKRAKIKHKTLCNSYEKGGLQSVDIEVKIKALQFSWVQRLFDDNEHQWKAIPRYLLKCAFNDTIVFHPHFCPPANSLSSFPLFYQNIIKTWNECSTKPLISRNILDQCIWHNAFLRIENKPFYFSSFAEANLNHVYQFFSPNGRIKDWITMKNEFDLNDRDYFKYRQIAHSIPSNWKTLIFESPLEFDGQIHRKGILQVTTLYTLEKLSSKQFYWAFIRKRDFTPTSQTYYEDLYDIDKKKLASNLFAT